MNYYLDFEFYEDGRTVDPISVGIVDEDGREFYAICKDFNFIGAWNNEWVRENVLRPIYVASTEYTEEDFCLSNFVELIKDIGYTKREIAYQIVTFIKEVDYPKLRTSAIPYSRLMQLSLTTKPVFWGYYCDYDWVVFCQLFGTMMNLPTSFPMYCKDLKQLCDDLGNPKLPKQLEGEHNALEDAKWNMSTHQYLLSLPKAL